MLSKKQVFKILSQIEILNKCNNVNKKNLFTGYMGK